MRTLKLTIAYDGTDYAGWQIQNSSRQHTADSTQQTARSRQRPTVQGTLERALGRLVQERVRIMGSGRTDAGVHALGQVAHVRLRSNLPVQRLQRSLNALLPPEIVVTRIEGAPSHFHARYHAVSKRYRYQMVTGLYILPCERRCYLHVPRALNLTTMRREAASLRGRHDFAAFQSAGRSVRDARRTIQAIRIRQPDARHVTLDIEANGFLYKMVRRIVGALLDVERGHRPPGTIARMLHRQEAKAGGPTAPACGLWLMDVRYPPRRKTSTRASKVSRASKGVNDS